MQNQAREFLRVTVELCRTEEVSPRPWAGPFGALGGAHSSLVFCSVWQEQPWCCRASVLKGARDGGAALGMWASSLPSFVMLRFEVPGKRRSRSGTLRHSQTQRVFSDCVLSCVTHHRTFTAWPFRAMLAAASRSVSKALKISFLGTMLGRKHPKLPSSLRRSE